MNELTARLDLLRQKVLGNIATNEEIKEAVVLMRAGRRVSQSVAPAPKARSGSDLLAAFMKAGTNG